jgi:malonyl-CoA/methylmalonyl-CoA synthetase
VSSNANLFSRFLECFPRKANTFLVDGTGVGYTYDDLDKKTSDVAYNLLDKGLIAGDRVTLIAEKSLNVLWIYLGCLRAGGVFHPINPDYTRAEVEFFLKDARPKILITDGSVASKIGSLPSQIECITAHLQIPAVDGEGLFREVGGKEHNLFPCHINACNDTAALLYSSGTTGDPKGICLTHGNLYENAVSLCHAWQFSSSDVLLHTLPIFHVHGLFIALGPVLISGASMQYRNRFIVEEVIEALPKATIMMGVPTYYTRLLDSPNFTSESSKNIRVFISGSAPLTENVFRRFEHRTCQKIMERYGMTETGVNSSNPIDGDRIPGSVGLVLPGVELRIINGKGNKVEGQTIGAIQVRGDNVFPRYWGLPDKTRQAFDEAGWFDTGDQGSMNSKGYLFISGRSKDMIITGGLNVYPKEVERELEKVSGIVETAVFGVPHRDFGEGVMAAVVMLDGEQLEEGSIVDVLNGQLAKFKIPKHIFAVDKLPRNAMGKVIKGELRKRYAGFFS